MKLRFDFIDQDIDGTVFLVPVGTEVFSGIIRSNKTAAFIIDCLKEETTEEKIIEKMCEVYDAPREDIASDVTEIVGTLRSINAIAD